MHNPLIKLGEGDHIDESPMKWVQLSGGVADGERIKVKTSSRCISYEYYLDDSTSECEYALTGSLTSDGIEIWDRLVNI